MRLHVLGTAGWMPTPGRETTCFAAHDDRALIVFDAGTGLRRLLTPRGRELVAASAAVHLVFTHFHLDHVCGLAYLPAVFAGRDVDLHVAPRSLTGTDGRVALAELVRPPYNPGPLGDWTNVAVHELPGADCELAGHRLRLRVQRHPGASVAYRLDDVLALVTDTPPDEATAAFASDVDVLLHECWYNDADPRTQDVDAALLPSYAAHSEVSAVAQLAQRAGARRLMLMHLNPLYDEDYYAGLVETARATMPETDCVPDETVLDLRAPV